MSFKALRRSRDAGKQQSPIISTPLAHGLVGGPGNTANPILSKPSSAKTFVPTKVIRAIDSRRGGNLQELSFSKGDFFYVIKDFDHNGETWYEVNNPVSGSRGIVPSYAFEELSKQAPTPRTSGFTIGSPLPPSTPQSALSYSHNSQQPVPSTPSSRHRAYLAIVQYDFQAERPDELDAKAGEAISVVAQSNREWFVAKPIGRLGGPGLIPVAFVELRDPDAPAKKMSEVEIIRAMDEGSLPKVELWKKATMDYKQSSIPLGVIDPTPSAPPVASPYPTSTTFDQQKSHSSSSGDHRYSSTNNNHNFTQPSGMPAESDQPEDEEEELLPPGMPISASIPSFHQESGEYWFRLDATYQPDPDDGTPNGELPPPIYMVLYRNYDGFYGFQLTLLDTFPVEAGRVKSDPNDPSSPLESDRILPFMPGPVDNVNDTVTIERKIDLNIYVHELMYLAGDPPGAAYILQSDLVRRFFSRKPGDVILEGPPPSARSNTGHGGGPQQQQTAANASNPQKQNSNQGQKTHQSQYSQHSSGSNSNPEREGSQSRGRSHSNAQSNYAPSGNGGSDPNRLRMNGLSIHDGGDDRLSRTSAYSDYKSHKSQPSHAGDVTIQPNGHGRGSESPYDANAGSSPTRSHAYSSRSPASATVPLSAPSTAPPLPDHHSAPSPAVHPGPTSQFLKLKVFHSNSDDLIALRVSPRITFAQLLDKIRDRLGKDISELKYTSQDKDTAGEIITILDDQDLALWVAENAKLVLYAY